MTQIKSNATVNSRRKADTNTPFLIAQEGRNSVDATLSNLSTSKQGLTQDDVEDRLQTHGLNQVSHEKAPNVFFSTFSCL
ncbi:cation-transporting P-type ATPase [Photobacterium kishitanii]|uniref:cation-transporting P-type ATPase n=1 Tax=Photobacterium kishitanii TaxID=318456 RepID=UPI0027382254|nr:cation-transporting P-type ATPase [Photobacterium kishitanii]